MLNLYIAPRGFRAWDPPGLLVDEVVLLLQQDGVIGRRADGAYAPGRDVAQLFHKDACDSLLPAELTFDALTVHSAKRATLLPRDHGEGFTLAECKLCAAELSAEELETPIAKLRYYPVDRFELQCPSCGSDLALANIDFGQPVAVARFWLFIEGAATARLNSSILVRVSRCLGRPLIVVPEVPEEDIEDWVPARRRRRR